MKNFDNSFLTDKIKFIAGVDEAGRGPLAGPVVSAAVIFDDNTFIEGVNDSKQLNETQREMLLPQILKLSLACSVSIVSHIKIDEINILQASLLSMRNAVDRLKVKPNLILIDGNKTFDYHIQTKAIIKGDTKSFSIAAASIVAKVARDRLMKRLDTYFPQYLWAKNKGYPTKEHIAALIRFGPSPFHRKTFLKNFII